MNALLVLAFTAAVLLAIVGYGLVQLHKLSRPVAPAPKAERRPAIDVVLP